MYRITLTCVAIQTVHDALQTTECYRALTRLMINGYAPPLLHPHLSEKSKQKKNNTQCVIF